MGFNPWGPALLKLSVRALMTTPEAMSMFTYLICDSGFDGYMKQYQKDNNLHSII